MALRSYHRLRASSVRRLHGFAYAEEFRHTRFDGIERRSRHAVAELPDDF